MTNVKTLYENYPRVQTVLDNGGFDALNELLTAIKDIRYIMHMASYLMNNCKPITKINASLDTKYTIIWCRAFQDSANKYVFAAERFTTAVNEVLTELIENYHGLLAEKYDMLDTTHPELCASFSTLGDTNQNTDHTTTLPEIRNDLDEIAGACYADPARGVENPTVVDKMLTHLFENAYTSIEATHMATMFDFDDYTLLFTSEDAVNTFSENCPFCTETFERSNCRWVKLCNTQRQIDKKENKK